MKADAAGQSQAISSVFFDVDGTLVDSNEAHARAWVDAFALMHKPIGFETIRPLIGMGTDKLLETLDVGITAESEAGKALAAQRKALFMERYLPHVQGISGARDLLALLKKREISRVVASAASAEELTPLLEIAGVADLIDHVVRADEAGATKPDPDIVAAALDWAKTGPQRAVMIGDTRFDIEAAHRAGVRCIALRCGGSSDDELAAADAIFDGPLELARSFEDMSLEELSSGRAPKGDHR